MANNVMDTANIINFFVALGTCLAVMVALFAKGQTSFENTFNILLTQHNDALTKLKENRNYNEKVSDIFNLPNDFDLSNLTKNMHNLDYFFGSYFRVLYHLLKHIDKNGGYHPFDHKGKKKYTSLVRSFLDNETTLLLAINCSHAKNNNQYYHYKCLIERYAFFEHLIVDKGKFYDYIKYSDGNLKYSINYIEQSDPLFVDKLISEIFKTYHSSAFGDHEDLY
ncbi:putative phage abortive infection protein [Raoultella ornithinolytica]|uniref:putative phage abortive infection protein n=1 Tax=Raoultella ornithinolytica TaxID=54291 RepID=UPI0027F1BEB7|nr:putative phage abortive infection protein [Raoultella ornithinolytica]MDV0598619.1 putative phage abortive infection protein [Raoultella ornithinolytica]HDT6088493.1 hypothetical protein [Raoultella ornithinolytica]